MLQTLWSIMPDKYPSVASRSTVMTAVASAILHMRHGNTGDPEFNKWNTEAIRLRDERPAFARVAAETRDRLKLARFG